MISKNLLYNIVNLTRILRCMIACRLRSVICILIFSIVSLLTVNKVFSQPFIPVSDTSLYPQSSPSAVIPIKTGQAVLAFTLTPPASSNVTEAYIIPSLTRGTLKAGIYGWYDNNGDADNRTWYTVIDADHIYFNGSLLGNTTLNHINDVLSLRNLGTVEERSRLISMFYSFIVVDPLDFRNYLSIWIVVGIALFIAIPPFWWLVRRFLK